MATRVLLLLAALALAGCRGEGTTSVTSPTSPAQPTPTTISATAKAYVDALLLIMQSYSVNTASIDWESFRSEVFAAAGVAQAVPDTYDAVRVALRLLNDNESYYQTNRGTPIGPSPVGGCAAAEPRTPALPDTMGCVKVTWCDCDGSAATAFAESIQRAIKAADRPGLTGWIVDLRGNIGGNMWPMIAGVGPVLGEGIIGYIVYNDREYEREYRGGASLSLGEAFAQVAAPYTLLKEYPRVAVLTDGMVASAGEAIVVYFKARPATRSFGAATCGHHHLLQQFALNDRAILCLVTSRHADRMKREYAGPLALDEIIGDPEEAVNRSVAWLQGGS